MKRSKSSKLEDCGSVTAARSYIDISVSMPMRLELRSLGRCHSKPVLMPLQKATETCSMSSGKIPAYKQLLPQSDLPVCHCRVRLFLGSHGWTKKQKNRPRKQMGGNNSLCPPPAYHFLSLGPFHVRVKQGTSRRRKMWLEIQISAL